MARSRRPRGLGSDVRGTLGSLGTLGTLVRSTLAQAGVVRDVLERGAREGRARLEEVRRDRQRTDGLADLGQAVLDLLEAGHFPELLEEPGVADAVAALDGGAESEPAAWPPRSERSREPEPDRRGRPTVPARARPRSSDDDGTVSSAQWRPPAPRAAAGPAAAARPAVWRPPVDADAPAKAAPPRAGGIQFGGGDDDDEADLAEYMHPDDVPPRT